MDQMGVGAETRPTLLLGDPTPSPVHPEYPVILSRPPSPHPPDHALPAAPALAITDLAAAMTPAMSARLLGMIMVLLVLARWPNSFRYASAMRRFTASAPPSARIAAAISRMPLAVTSR